MDTSALAPRYINIRRGAYVGLILSIALCPWELLASAQIFLQVISAFTIFFAPLCGIQVVDYFIVRRRKVKLSHLFKPHPHSYNIYFFVGGLNFRALLAWIVGFAPLLAGLISNVRPQTSLPTAMRELYSLGFLWGFPSASLCYAVANWFFPPQGVWEVDSEDVYGTFI